MSEVKRFLNRLGLRRKRRVDMSHEYPSDFSQETIETIGRVRSATQTSPERIAALCDAVKYISRCQIPGDIVECGVWRGGSMMAAAITLQRLAERRQLHLFDTFEGMTNPSTEDVAPDGKHASTLLSGESKDDPWSVWCVSPLDEVRSNMESTGYPAELIHYVPGTVEETLPAEAPDQIALLRLDTDWYASTKHELEHLYHRISPGGVLIIDDYGHWEGARRAVDEFIADNQIPILLNRIDYTGRIGIVNVVK